MAHLIVSNSPSCALAAASVDELSLFSNVNPDSKPIATKSRRFSFSDKTFIAEEISRLMSENIIEHSTSLWRAQVVVVKSPSHSEKKRLCVDYSQTVNQYTAVDAYPLPRIDDNQYSSEVSCILHTRSQECLSPAPYMRFRQEIYWI